MELRRSEGGLEPLNLNDINRAATEPHTTASANTDQTGGGRFDGHPISPIESQVPTHNSLFENIGTAITRWWTGNRTPTDDQHQRMIASRLSRFDPSIRSTSLPKKTLPNYRSTIVGSTFAEREITRQAERQAIQETARQTAQQSQQQLPPPSFAPPATREQSEPSRQREGVALARFQKQAAATGAASSNASSSPVIQEVQPDAQLTQQPQQQLPPAPRQQQSEAARQRETAALTRLQQEPSTAAGAASSSAASSSGIENHDEEMKSANTPHSLSHPLLTRTGEISDRLDSLTREIPAQQRVTQRAGLNLEQADEKFVHLAVAELEQSEPRRQQAQYTSAGVRAGQDYEYQQSAAEDLHAILKKETAKLTSLQEQDSLLEQQLHLVGQVHSKMDGVQTRLTSLEGDYKKLGTTNDNRIVRGNKALQEARSFLQTIVATTLSIADERDLTTMSARIAREEESTAQLQKATRSLDLAQSALDAVKNM